MSSQTPSESLEQRAPAPEAGGATGSASLEKEPPATPAPQKRSALLLMVVPFCLGLIGLCLLAGSTRLNQIAGITNAELFQDLPMLLGSGVVLYLLARRAEGDFRALFISSFTLFMGSEALEALIGSYQLLMLHNLRLSFNVALFVFSSLALTASLAPGQRRDVYQRALLAANLGFMFLGAFKTFNAVKKGADPRQNAILAIVLLILVVYLAIVLVRAEMRSAKAAAAPVAQTTPGLTQSPDNQPK